MKHRVPLLKHSKVLWTVPIILIIILMVVLVYMRWRVLNPADTQEFVNKIMIASEGEEGESDSIQPININPQLNASDLVKLNIRLEGIDFGYATSQNAGDINNDGFDDIVVSALQAGNNKGLVFIFFGRSNFPKNLNAANADVIIIGNIGNNNETRLDGYMGKSISTNGDVNGDGIDDLLISGGLNRGEVFLFYGRSKWENIYHAVDSDILIVGEDEYDFFGNDIELIQDFNGDDFADIIIGAYGDKNTPDSISKGRAYVIYGRAAMPNNIKAHEADWIINGINNHDNLGKALSTAGDLNRDGFEDIILSAYRAGDVNANTRANGSVFVFYGSSNARTGEIDASVANIIVTGTDEGDSLGADVASAGDINNDGFDDVIMSARHSDFEGNMYGMAYLLKGGANIPSTIRAQDIEIKMVGNKSLSSTGWTLSPAGDMNGDSFDDFIIGSMDNDTSKDLTFVHLGSTKFPANSKTVNAAVTFSGEAVGDRFGFSTGNGDYNRDGYSDIVIGAIDADSSVSESGAVYVYLSKP